MAVLLGDQLQLDTAFSRTVNQLTPGTLLALRPLWQAHRTPAEQVDNIRTLLVQALVVTPLDLISLLRTLRSDGTEAVEPRAQAVTCTAASTLGFPRASMAAFLMQSAGTSRRSLTSSSITRVQSQTSTGRLSIPTLLLAAG